MQRMNDLSLAMELMRCFPHSFINQHGEFIAEKHSNSYFALDNCKDRTDIKCKVLEWLSRPASNGQPYESERANDRFRTFMLDGINKYLGTNFSHDDIDEIYTYLGNCCNHAKTLRFIESGYDMSVLANKEGM